MKVTVALNSVSDPGTPVTSTAEVMIRTQRHDVNLWIYIYIYSIKDIHADMKVNQKYVNRFNGI